MKLNENYAKVKSRISYCENDTIRIKRKTLNSCFTQLHPLIRIFYNLDAQNDSDKIFVTKRAGP